jgi:hypothetical protein
MIQIDDAGSGSFVGGTCIGVYRPETNEYYFDIIPVELYSNENFKKKLYLEEVVKIVEIAFNALQVDKNEQIDVCRGYMFDTLKKWFKEKGYSWNSIQITGRLQEIVEQNFELYTIRLGLPEMYIKFTKYPFHFHKLLRWVLADYDDRIGLCKTGWKSWQKIKDIDTQEFEDTISNSHIYCMKCGSHITPGSLARVLTYTSNKENYIYMHQNCPV